MIGWGIVIVGEDYITFTQLTKERQSPSRVTKIPITLTEKEHDVVVVANMFSQAGHWHVITGYGGLK